MASTVPSEFEPLTGHCTCKAITYAVTASPLAVNCCHCTSCQRETGSPFAMNIEIETFNLHLASSTTPATQPTLVATPSASGTPQLIARCPTCLVALYSHYGGNKVLLYVRAGTLGEGSRHRVKPDAHIFTDTKAEWVDLRSEVERGAKVFVRHYERGEVWSKGALERRERVMEQMKT